MTVAVSLKVHDGIVLAADSASTLIARQPDGTSAVINVYDNANKIVNLYKGLPLGVITWGSGSIGSQSMTSIFKDLRQMFLGQRAAPGGADWSIDRQDYTVADVAEKVRSYVFDELYGPAFGDWADPPSLGMVVAGYSADGQHAEEYQIEKAGSEVAAITTPRMPSECGFTVAGQPEAVLRLVSGVDPRLPQVLHESLGVAAEEAGPATAVIRDQLQMQLVQDAMPFQDALDLAEFFVDLTIKMSRFCPGPGTVGGPIELAGITRHEGFKWIKRKHYYEGHLNPQELG